MTEINETSVLKKAPTIIDDDKNTKLHHSAATGKEDLIKQNFYLNATTPVAGITPLMFTSAMENCDVAHGITESRNQKVEKKHNDSKNSPTLISNSPHKQSVQTSMQPYIVISPQPTYYKIPANQMVSPHIRKSSNTMSPGFYLITSNITPVTPLNLVSPPKMFFGPEFSPNQIW